MSAVPWGQRTRVLTAILAGFALLAAHTALAQTSGPIAPKPGQAVQKPPQGASQKALDQSIRVRVNLVNTPVVVRDARGELVLDLLENNFRVFDNGVQQKLEGFDMGSGPLSAVLGMETSARVQPFFPALRRTRALFTETVMGESGDGAVICYDDQGHLLEEFTREPYPIDKRLA